MFHEEWLDEVHVNEWAVNQRAKEFEKKPNKAWSTLESLILLKVITLIDLTTLGGDDTFSNVTALVNKAAQPLSGSLVRQIVNSLNTLLHQINATVAEKRNFLKIDIKKTNDRKYSIQVIGNVDLFEINKCQLQYEELVEVKQILRKLRLDDKENTKEAVSKFLSLHTNDKNNEKSVRVGAICVYPSFVSDAASSLDSKGLHIVSRTMPYECNNKHARNELKPLSTDGTLSDDTEAIENDTGADEVAVDVVPIAAVAAGFPSGLYGLESKIKEITFAVSSGASEIDIVISRYLVLGHRWLELYNEVSALKKACGKAKMKTILAVGECGSFENVYKASMVSMMAGSDYIKTSTGKEAVNATFPFGLVMCRAIKNYYIKTGKKIGFKAAGGIRTSEDAVKWFRMIVTELGTDWLPLFRIGASGVLKNIEQRLKEINS